jgi:hypothetical protein
VANRLRYVTTIIISSSSSSTTIIWRNGLGLILNSYLFVVYEVRNSSCIVSFMILSRWWWHLWLSVQAYLWSENSTYYRPAWLDCCAPTPKWHAWVKCLNGTSARPLFVGNLSAYIKECAVKQFLRTMQAITLLILFTPWNAGSLLKVESKLSLDLTKLTAAYSLL